VVDEDVAVRFERRDEERGMTALAALGKKYATNQERP